MMTPALKGATTEPSVDWTIMLYIAADDVLANFAVQSLKQLNESASAPDGQQDKANVVVAAQFALPAGATGPRPAKTPAVGSGDFYIFKKGKALPVPGLTRKLVPAPETVKTPRTAKTPEKVNMSQQQKALIAFMQRVYSECEPSRYYALILWGHGPELLLQPAAGSLTGSSDSMYITPEELRGALEGLRPPNGHSLDIIGFDACYMSMFEMAYELQGLARYMVASQEEVPDASFPYDKLVELFREGGKLGNGGKLDSLLKRGVEAYVSAYQDCICNENTGMKSVTLSALDLNPSNSTELKKAVRALADTLVKAKDKESLANPLIEARTHSKDYASGLYVDLYDFCEKLDDLIKITEIKSACQDVLKAFETSNFILKHSGDKRSHGISIYLPYLTPIQYAEVSKPLVKGGDRTHGGKGFGEAINGAATEYLMCARRSLILDTEKDYGGLKLAEDTHWYSFITDVWTSALIKKEPADLDFHYSAQQSWMNVCRRSIRR